jgi:ribonuclease HI
MRNGSTNKSYRWDDNLCIRKNISLEVEWIPREQNQTADAYSKVFDYDDWSISDKFFDFFQ